jgi:hypothetical protein
VEDATCPTVFSKSAFFEKKSVKSDLTVIHLTNTELPTIDADQSVDWPPVNVPLLAVQSPNG